MHMQHGARALNTGMHMRKASPHSDELALERIATSLERLCETVPAALERLIDSVDMLVGTLVPPQPHEKAAGCQHPEDSRTDLSGPGKRGKFYCRECGFRN